MTTDQMSTDTLPHHLNLIYLAHPYGGDPRNLALAEDRRGKMQEREPRVIILAPWISMARQQPDSGEMRRRALELCCIVASRCDAIVLTGTHISEGMAAERDACAAAGGTVIDLTDAREGTP